MKEAHVNMLFTDTDRKQGGPSPKYATIANVHFREKGNAINKAFIENALMFARKNKKTQIRLFDDTLTSCTCNKGEQSEKKLIRYAIHFV